MYEIVDLPKSFNCYGYVYSKITGEPEEGHMMMVHFMEKITQLGYKVVSAAEAEFVLKIEEGIEGDGMPYHAMYVEGRDDKGEIYISHRPGSQDEVENAKLKDLIAKRPETRFAYYGK
ncbi:MAG: hypothetical protein U0525_03215 [Patescibacteria group bacterium]